MKKGEYAHNPGTRGVYVEGHGVVQPGGSVRKTDEDGVNEALKANSLAAGRAPKADAEERVQGDPDPVTIDVGAVGVPETGNDEEGAR